MDLTHRLLALAEDRTLRAAGSMLNGIVHNLNNPAHALNMQIELFMKSLHRDLAGRDASVVENKCRRLRHIGEDFRNHLEVLSWRGTYCRPQVELVDPVHFGTWLLQFWRNNLFFKHSMVVDLQVQPSLHVKLIPLALLWCLEEPLSTMTSAFSNEHVQTEFGMRFEIQRFAENGVFFRMTILPTSETRDFPVVELEHGENMRALSRELGWDLKYSSDNMLSVLLTIPGTTRA
ncbi:MAG TPA: hypothetical protein ENN39_03975 [Desulfonatronum sp.]|nr:hypothetical protein [Desulfonatronum sp.]